MKISALSISITCLFACIASSHADTFGTGANQFDIDFVTIGNPGNPADTDPNAAPTLPGSVAYTYRIGKYEISEDMIDKANALGGLGITKDTRGPNKPATSVSWFEAARFVNWLNSSQGHTPAYKFAIQPGEPGYNIFQENLLWEPGDAGYNPANLFRNSQARYFLPSAQEWYKAAYYDPSAGVYYDYPTGSDTTPDGIDFTGDTTFDAVFFDGGSNPEPNDITNVGLLSPYGTAGQGGNVFEWEESSFDLLNRSASTARGVRGGDWGFSSNDLLPSIRDVDIPTGGAFLAGFRVASTPEPSTALMGTMAAVGILLRRKR